jgi:CheY-like chemotaxis protein
MATVLVVDDEDSIRLAICMVLEDAGYPVLEAQNGLEALQVMHASKDGLVVLLDLMMPRLGAGRCWRLWTSTRPSPGMPSSC